MRTLKTWRGQLMSWIDARSELLARRRAQVIADGEGGLHAHLRNARAKASVGVMAQRVGVDPLQLANDEWLYDDIVHKCEACAEREACRTWFADPTADADGYREFCVNAKRFDTLKDVQ